MDSFNNIFIIPSGEDVQGYYWFSNSELPVVVDGHFNGLNLSDYITPFIIEAQLYNRGKQVSYSVKYIDGHYYIQETNVTEQTINDAKSFISKWDDNLNLLFTTRWIKKPDSLCCNMDVLMPANCIFVGFKR